MNRSLVPSKSWRSSFWLVVTLLWWAPVGQAQQPSYDDDYRGYQDDYSDVPPDGGAYQDDYANDPLYHDYAMRQQEKALGQAGGQTPVWAGWGAPLVLGGAVGWLLGGKFHAGRVQKQLKAKHKEEQKKVYQQYYTDVYTLQQQNADLVATLEQLMGPTPSSGPSSRKVRS